MKYEAWQFTVDPPQPGTEILTAVLGELGFESFEPNESGMTAYIPAGLINEGVVSSLSFDDFTFSYDRKQTEEVNWNAAWESSFEPVRIGNELLIRASFHESDPSVTDEIVITPKMSFGTGHHQTTRLMCISMLEDLDLRGKRVLDMGCGTGILAILAAKKGAGEVTAVDIDEWCVSNATENCALNGHPGINILKDDGSLLPTLGKFDIVIANINRNVLASQIPSYAKLLPEGGFLLLSGFFRSDVEFLESVCKANNIVPVKARHDGDWTMLLLRKGS